VAEAVVRLRVDASGATRALNGVQNQTNKLQSSFNGLRTAIAATGITLIGRQAVRTSANFDKLNVRLKLLTKSSKDFAKSQQIAADAQKAFGLSAVEALEGVTDITARLAPLGTSVEDIRTVFFGFNTAAKLAGASAIESSNAFRQLAQALGSGRLAGDEFRSVSEQVPTILAPIAEELGVTIGQLKKLAADGKLTSEVVLRALGRVGNEGSGFLKQLLANDPTQVFKNFTNATEDLSRAFGKELRPAVESVTKNLTALINKIVEFSGSDIGKTSILITKIAVSAKLLTVAATAATAAVAIIVGKLTSIGAAAIIAKGGFGAIATSSLLAAKGIGAVTLAAGALKVALLASGVGAFALVVGGLATAFFKAKREAQEFTDLLESGSQEDVTKAFEKQKKAVEALEKQLERTNSRRAGQIRQRLEDEQAELRLLENKLNTLAAEERITEEQKKQNEEKKKSAELIKKQQEEAEKLKEKFMEIGMSIEQGVVQNLTDAAMGTKSLGEAAISVLNDLKRKLIEVAMQQAVSGLGQFLGTALGSIFSGGIGGGGGGLGMTQGASLPSNPVGFSGYSRPTVRLGRGTAFRANGGPVSAGGSYIVGEKGPEMFTPSRSGTIIPNNAMGGVTNNIVVNVDASGTAVEGNDAESNQFGEQLAAAIQAEIINQKRSGGLLA
tara:strand:+ start:841 stop:2853 length:2013 start_codon:yes stop_codon:yes gene_type:complete